MRYDAGLFHVCIDDFFFFLNFVTFLASVELILCICVVLKLQHVVGFVNFAFRND